MPETKCFAQVRGSVIRATRLDGGGKPITGALGVSAVAVSKRVSSVTLDEESDDGTNIRERNMGGELCIVDDAYASVIGYSADIQLCGVDPDLLNVFTKSPVVTNSNSDIIGFDADTGINLDDFAFSLEVWSRIAGGGADAGGNRAWGYSVFPFLKGGRLGGFSFEDAAVQFSIQGAQTRDGNQWGTGPFNSMRLGVSPWTPSKLFTPLRANTHFRNIITYLEPPAPTCGAVALAAV